MWYYISKETLLRRKMTSSRHRQYCAVLSKYVLRCYIYGGASMAITISPLDLLLDTQNPRFVILTNRTQEEIRKYLVTYEDVCQLSSAINEFGSLLPGERIVALYEDGQYVVVEGNRRTCSLQMLLNRGLIPDGFAHRIPHTSQSIIDKCSIIEVDVLPDRNAALELMTKRHIQGVKEWKPLAKKQFFAANYKDGQGQSVQDLSRITSVRESEIKEDIRDYKFFSFVYEKYVTAHPDFNREIVVLKTDPFWRIFKAKFEYPVGTKVSPKDFLKLSYDETYNTISALPQNLFEQITQLVFEKAIVQETITTRNVLTDVEGIVPLLQLVESIETGVPNPGAETPPADTGTPPPNNGGVPTPTPNTTPNGGQVGTRGAGDDAGVNGGTQHPGGPPPRTFFETISWRGKLDPAKEEHQGLICAIDELYKLSTITCGRQKAYKTFPIATGMILRSVYEQALNLRLHQAGLWGAYCRTRNGKYTNGTFPTLSSMENFINAGTNKGTVFPDQGLLLAYDRVIAATHREFLNANIHYPGNINVTPASLEAIAAGGMYFLIQGIINLIN